jgi:myo-inositol-1-phosphate synthase
MASRKDENVHQIFDHILRDKRNKDLTKIDFVKDVYGGVFLEQVLESVPNLISFSRDNDKLKILDGIFILFSTYTEENPNIEDLPTLSKLVVSAEEILTEMYGKDTIETNKNFEQRNCLLDNFAKRYKELIYRLIIVEQIFTSKEDSKKNQLISQLQTDHTNVVSNLLNLFKSVNIPVSVQNDLALTILMWKVNSSVEAYIEFVILYLYIQI